MMRRTSLAALPLALLALAAPAAAKDGRQHTTYRATLAPVAAAEPAASASRRGGAAVVRGKAVLVDGRKRDRIKLRIRGLDRGTSYTWELRRGGCSGEAVGGFRYRALKVRRGGTNGRARSRSFAAAAGASYALVVTGPEGDVACGEFARKGARGKRGGDEPEAPACEEAPSDDELDEASLDDPSADDDLDDASAGDEPLAEPATDDPCGDDSGADTSGDELAGDDDADEPGAEDDEPEDF